MAITMARKLRERTTTNRDPAPAEVLLLLDDLLPRVYGYILVRVGRDGSLAEDLTQDVLFALYRTLEAGTATVANPGPGHLRQPATASSIMYAPNPADCPPNRSPRMTI